MLNKLGPGLLWICYLGLCYFVAKPIVLMVLGVTALVVVWGWVIRMIEKNQ